MSKADKLFIETVENILKNGTSTESQEVRPHWSDGTPAHTKKLFGVVNRYNLAEEFPAITLRKMYLKNALDELLWIWQKKSNRVEELSSHVWDQWADEYGTIGKAYGYQLGKRYQVNGITVKGLRKAFPNMTSDITWEGTVRDKNVANYGEHFYHGQDKAYGNICAELFVRHTLLGPEETWEMDQVNKVIYDLKNNPFSRRIMTTIWNPAELTEMNLEPCAYSMTFNVTEHNGKLILNGLLNQRSQDMLAANGWNVAQYALLTMMLAQICGYEVGEFVHVIADAHIYDRHIPIVEELIKREPKPAPKVWFDPEIKDFYEFTKESLHIEDYEVGGEQIKFEVAI